MGTRVLINGTWYNSVSFHFACGFTDACEILAEFPVRLSCQTRGGRFGTGGVNISFTIASMTMVLRAEQMGRCDP
jgi:hypothetical protein